MRDQRNTNNSGTINFLSRFQNSDQFDKIFKEGMGLVEETANYLDGQGRVDSRVLDRPGTIAYATESMRLTTRLMQLASWLLLQRAMISGEVNETEARREKYRLAAGAFGFSGGRSGWPKSSSPGASSMPRMKDSRSR